MNIIEQTEALKDLPDQRLMQEMQSPTGFAPQFLVLSELKRRKRMRDEYQRQQAADMQTVAEETITAAGVPQGGIMQMAKAMNPNSSIAQNTGMDQAPQMQPTRMADGGVVKMQTGGIPMYTPDAAKALQARPGAMTGGLISNIARLKVNYPELYEQYKDSPQLAEVAATAAEGMSAVTPELTGLEQMEEGRSFDTLRSLFTDPSNRAVTRQALETEAMQSEINAAAEAQRAAALERGDESLFAEGSVAEYLRGTPEGGLPRKSEAYDISGTMVSPDVEDYIPQISGEQSFVLQRPEGALLNVPTTKGGDRPSAIDTSELKSFDVRSGMGDVYAEPEKIRAAEDAALAGIGSLGGALTMDEAIAAAARQRMDAPISPQVEQPMLIDQQATALIPDDRSMEGAASDQRERFLRAQDRRMDYLGPIVPDDTISSTLVGIGEGAIEGAGSLFEMGVGGLEAAQQSVANTRESVAEALMQRDLKNAADIERAGFESAQEKADRAALLEGFTLGDPNAPDAEGALSFGELLKSSTDKDDTSTNPAGNKTTGGQKASATSSLGGIEGRIAQMLEEKEKNAQSDKWMALAQAGMALMSSKEPTLAGAIGEAGLVGVGALKKGKAQYDKDVLALLTLQQRIDAQKARASGKTGGLTASNMISYLDDLGRQKSDLREEIRDINNNPLLTEEQKAAQISEVQVLMSRIDYEAGIYRKALRGDTTGDQSFDVRGGSQTQSGVGYSLGTATQ